MDASRDASIDDATSLDIACGQLLFVGFEGTELPGEVRDAFAAGLRGGAILFRRNLRDVAGAAELNAAIIAACPRGLPPVIGVDQEGGRVMRLGPPALQVPRMRKLAERGEQVVERVAHAVGRELSALGFSMSFAPVLDVDSNPNNPIIGDRSFARDPGTVARLGTAYVRGLQRAGVLACAKHFPGHGDTEEDSHLSLPRVRHERARIEAVELAPFRAIVKGDGGSGPVDAIMTAHVVFDALDPDLPATLSRAVVTRLLREEMGFAGVCISDDLFMKGISPSGGSDVREIAEAGVRAIDAGCDLLLVCHPGAAADAVHGALLARARRDEVFAARVRQAFARGIAMRRRAPPRVVEDRAAIFAETARALD